MSQIVPNLFYLNEFDDDYATMYDPFLGKLLPDIQLDGLNCAVPTRTTPTITPVTPTNLDQTLLSYQLETESHQNEAGFVPPLLQPSIGSWVPGTTAFNSVQDSGAYFSMVDSKGWQEDDVSLMQIHNTGSMSPLIPPHVMSISSGSSGSSSRSSSSSSSSSRRKKIGRRYPNVENGVSPEEEERRRLRRERNKEAAARCRKRRLDHTIQLTYETEELELKKQYLEAEIEKVKIKVESLRKILEFHGSICQLTINGSPLDIKPFVKHPELTHVIETGMNNRVDDDESRIFTLMNIPTSINNNSMVNSVGKLRPNFLPIGNSSNSVKNGDIPISTPSTEFLDSILGDSEGLTPISSALIACSTGLAPVGSSTVVSCSTQLRSLNGIDLTSPDSNVKKLVSL